MEKAERKGGFPGQREPDTFFWELVGNGLQLIGANSGWDRVSCRAFPAARSLLAKLMRKCPRATFGVKRWKCTRMWGRISLFFCMIFCSFYILFAYLFTYFYCLFIYIFIYFLEILNPVYQSHLCGQTFCMCLCDITKSAQSIAMNHHKSKDNRYD